MRQALKVSRGTAVIVLMASCCACGRESATAPLSPSVAAPLTQAQAQVVSVPSIDFVMFYSTPPFHATLR